MSGGQILNFINDIKEIENLKYNDNILIIETCNHDRKCNDIATVQIPNKIREYTQKKINFYFNFGQLFLTDNELKNGKYKLAIICGGCMIDEQKYCAMLGIIQSLNIPISNFGTLFSYIKDKKMLEKTTKLYR